MPDFANHWREETAMKRSKTPVALVMNMFYTGLGIARSLGSRGIRVIGLSAHRGIYGNYTRFAEVRHCPDSREEPEQLIEFLMKLGEELGLESPGMIFPTRDDDVLFLDRFRDRLSAYFVPVIPSSEPLRACLDKWETSLSAERASVAAPRCWKIDGPEDLDRILPEILFPCVLKPVSSHHWRKRGNWERVGARKAIGIQSAGDLKKEYEAIARADSRAILQEMVPGADDQLSIVACYISKTGILAASFTAQKVVQMPEGFGTGCIVRSAARPELIPVAAALLKAMSFTGIAEVEFKWDARFGVYKLIEVNPRPWDQHRLGHAMGVDLIYSAYCDFAGLPTPTAGKQSGIYNWIAEDVFLLGWLQSAWKRDGKSRALLDSARGKRVYGIWWGKDPLPSCAYMATTFLAGLTGRAIKGLGSAVSRRLSGKRVLGETTAL
jgi:predicted ATP-grasp superfamily ATP-dependent carboligase